MRRWLHQIEVMVDAVIPYLLIVLAVLLLGEMLTPRTLTPYANAIEVFDWFVISCFAIDLTFKYRRVRNIPKFIRRYWLDIIATLPVFLVLRTIEEMARLGKLLQFQAQLEQPQVIVHEGLMIQRQVQRIVGEAERFGELSRFERFGRWMERAPRFLRGMPFFERPTGGHHPGERKVRSFASHRIVRFRNRILHRRRMPLFR